MTAVIFDMDGLLIDSEPTYTVIWKKACAHFGFELSDSRSLLLKGTGRRAALEAVCGWALEDGIEISPDPLKLVLEATEPLLFETDVPLKPGALQLLDRLKNSKITSAIASSTRSQRVRDRVEKLGIQDYFSAITGGDEVTRGKPNPDIFLLAASKIGVEPTRCLVLEDSDHGIDGAIAAGMTAVLVPDTSAPRDITKTRAHHILRDLSEVPELPFFEGRLFSAR